MNPIVTIAGTHVAFDTLTAGHVDLIPESIEFNELASAFVTINEMRRRSVQC